jgi:hypothetical protein
MRVDPRAKQSPGNAILLNLAKNCNLQKYRNDTTKQSWAKEDTASRFPRRVARTILTEGVLSREDFPIAQCHHRALRISSVVFNISSSL